MSNSDPSIQRVQGMRDGSVTARVLRRLLLHYDAGADPLLDRPRHVRAGSGLAWAGDRLAIAQDDANFIAFVDVRTGGVESVALPANELGQRLFDKERGNKKHKHDFEAITTSTWSDGAARLMLFGSGSTRRRESIAVLEEHGGEELRIIHAPKFYTTLRACHAFAGSELNIEGAVRVGEVLRFVGRGNGELREGIVRINATCDISWAHFERYLADPQNVPAPTPHNVIQYELGAMDGTRITFTDACIAYGSSGGQTLLFTGTAEESEDVVLDGPVSGSVIGAITSGIDARARWAPITDASGQLLRAKVEGIAPAGRADRVWVVVDADDHNLASELWEVEVAGLLSENAVTPAM